MGSLSPHQSSHYRISKYLRALTALISGYHSHILTAWFLSPLLLWFENKKFFCHQRMMKFHVWWQVIILSTQFWKYIMYFWYSVALDCFSSVWLCASGFVHRTIQGALCVCTCTLSFRSSFINKMGGGESLLWNDMTFLFFYLDWS